MSSFASFPEGFPAVGRRGQDSCGKALDHRSKNKDRQVWRNSRQVLAEILATLTRQSQALYRKW
jgi:hypothetical protein